MYVRAYHVYRGDDPTSWYTVGGHYHDTPLTPSPAAMIPPAVAMLRASTTVEILRAREEQVSWRAMAEQAPGSQCNVRRFGPNLPIDRDGAELKPSRAISVATVARATATATSTAFKRGALRIVDALIPRGE